MDIIKNYCDNILKSPLVVCVYSILVLVLLVLIYLAVTKQGFLNEFRSAPIAAQRSSELLGVGNPLRFTSEFGSTNQGGSNVVSEVMESNMKMGTEHMMGGFEPPVYHDVNRELSNYQSKTASNSGKEFFGENGRTMFSEAFNVDDKLSQLLHNN